MTKQRVLENNAKEATMEPKATTIDEAAAECAAALSEEDIAYFRLHIDYTHHHFEYGLYLRNRYCDLLWTTGYWDRDSLSRAIYQQMLPLLFPEFRGYEAHIETLTSPPFDDLNANYNLRFGRNYLADITPDAYPLLLAEPPDEPEARHAWWEQHKAEFWAERDRYSCAIAERIWQRDAFREKALALGYTDAEIDEVCETCRMLLQKRRMFVPLEIMFTKHATPASRAALLEAPELFDWLFEKQRSHLEQLPDYVFSDREIVLRIVRENGGILSMAPQFSADREIAEAALCDGPFVADTLDPSLWGDRALAEVAARHAQASLLFEHDAFKMFDDDDAIVRLALEANGANISCAAARIRGDLEMAKLALTHQRHLYPYATFPSLSEALRGRKDLALLELQAPSPSLNGFTEALLDDDDIAEALLANEELTWMFSQMSPRIMRKYLDRLPPRTRESCQAKLDAADQSTQKEGNDGTIGDGQM